MLSIFTIELDCCLKRRKKKRSCNKHSLHSNQYDIVANMYTLCTTQATKYSFMALSVYYKRFTVYCFIL